MTVEKLSLSFPKKLAREIQRAAKREGMSVSAWMARAAEREAKLAKGRELLARYESEHGPISEEVLRRVRKLWPA